MHPCDACLSGNIYILRTDGRLSSFDEKKKILPLTLADVNNIKLLQLIVRVND